MGPSALSARLESAIAARECLLDQAHEGAYRLFNGFFEGAPDVVVDLYARTIVVHLYADTLHHGAGGVTDEVIATVLARLPWIQAAVAKTRSAPTQRERCGEIVSGQTPDRVIREHGIRYALDLRMNRDTSFYIDTRGLRQWALEHTRGRSVLNTFAYTGSLGVAALAGGASEVVQLDLNRRFLDLARASCELNGLPVADGSLVAGDFWSQVSRMKRRGRRFDCVILDPPFFATTSRGTVDLATNSARLINKVRPLINDGGHLVAVNNALFVSGADYLRTLETLCADGYLELETLIPVPTDFIGFPNTTVRPPVTDPAPFNHSTKIAVLRVRRKNPQSGNPAVGSGLESP